MKARLLRRWLVLSLLPLGAAAAALAADDATLDVPPLHATVPIDPAQLDGDSVAFREISSGILNSQIGRAHV